MASGLQARFRRSIDQGLFYDAEQACRTVYHRLCKSGKHPDALAALLDGARQLLAARQVNSGTALAIMAAGHMSDPENGSPYAEEGRGWLRELVGAYPTDPASTEEAAEWGREKLGFVRAAIKWSQAKGGPEYGDEEMNAVAGRLCAVGKDYPAAQKHFLRSNDPAAHAEAVIAWAEEEGVRSEVDLFMVRTILRYLVTANLADANVVYTAFVAKYGPGFSPLANFADMLLQTLERENAYPLMLKLQEAYQPSLARDPALASYLGKVATAFYNVQPAQPGGLFGGLMGDMMRGFMGPPTSSS